MDGLSDRPRVSDQPQGDNLESLEPLHLSWDGSTGPSFGQGVGSPSETEGPVPPDRESLSPTPIIIVTIILSFVSAVPDS